MDVFSAVISAIHLAERVGKLVDDYHKAPERLQRLQFDIKSLQSTLERLKTTDQLSKDQRLALESEIVEIETILHKILCGILKLKSKTSENVLSRSIRSLRMQMNLGDLDELAQELQKRKTSLTLAVNTVNLGMVSNIEANVQSRAAQLPDGMTSAIHKPDTHHASRMTSREFLDSLQTPNYVDDQFRIKEPSEGTASWIYDSTEYKQWLETLKPLASVHLIGKMGSGKSVLMKSVIRKLRTQIPKPTRHGSAVLYYFCTCVNRTDTPLDILKGFTAQLVNDCGGLFEETVSNSELLQVKRWSADPPSWSFEALSHIFTTLMRHARFSNLYCIVDALDECESTGLDELLQLLLGLAEEPSLRDTKTRLLFSSREHSHILTSLEASETCFRVFVRPHIVEPDIRVAMQDDLSKLKKVLNLDEEETERLQEALLEKSDGMFLWVSLAIKEIMANCHDATNEDLEELINDLPFGLKGLYEKSWIKLLESLPTKKISLAKRVLVWLLLAKRALTIPELTIALAVKPGEKNVPSTGKLLRSLSSFVLTYLTPFVQISGIDATQQPPNATEDGSLKGFEPIGPKIRLVHQSAQDYLLGVCKRSKDRQSASSVEIDLRGGHEAIARVCISYLQCEELQLGWIGLENRDSEGWQIMTDETKRQVRKRLETHTFLEYAANNWAYHVRQCQFLPVLELPSKCEGSEKEDIFQYALDLLQRYRPGYECATQVRRLTGFWDDEVYYGPGPALSVMVACDISVLVRRLLNDPATDLYVRDDADDSLPIHCAATANMPTIHPEERREIIEMLLEKGADINCVDIVGNTPMHCASAFPLPEVVKIFIEKGSNTCIKNRWGDTPLNQELALRNQEIVEMLIQGEADTETPDDGGYPPIVKAASFSIWETVRLFVRYGLDLKSTNLGGFTCLHVAAECGEISIIELLLDANVPVDIKSNHGFTPLHTAACNDQFESARVLVERGANPATASDYCTLPLHLAAEHASPRLLELLLKHQTNVDVWGEGRCTPLHYAVIGKFPDNVSLLLKRNADIEARCDFLSSSPLHLAVSHERLESVRVLLDHGTDINSLDENATSALMDAGSDGNMDMVQFLIERGAPVNENDIGKFGALHYAAMSGWKEIVEYLLRHGADIEHPGPNQFTPLFFCAKNGDLEMSKLLFANGAKVNSDNYGLDALSPTCVNGHTEVVKWLIENGADLSRMTISSMIGDAEVRTSHTDIANILLDNGVKVDAVNYYTGETALFDCIAWGRLDMVKVLLEHGADVNSRSTKGDTPLSVALKAGKAAIAELLRAHGASPTVPEEEETNLCENLQV